MKFLKYRNTWAWGYNDWEIILISSTDEYDEDLLEEKIQELNGRNNWSDKFRGIEYEIIDYPGHEWMKQNIERCKRTIKYNTRLLGEYNALFYKNGGS